MRSLFIFCCTVSPWRNDGAQDKVRLQDQVLIMTMSSPQTNAEHQLRDMRWWAMGKRGTWKEAQGHRGNAEQERAAHTPACCLARRTNWNGDASSSQGEAGGTRASGSHNDFWGRRSRLV